jgi:hypothetical protein
MGPELPDEADESPDGNADRRDDQDDDGQAVRPGNAEAETRNREEYYTDLRTAVSTEESTTVQRITAEEKAAAKKWDKQTEESRWMWTEYQRRWPPSERTPVDRAADSSASWVGDRNRSLDSADNGRVEAACDRIADWERERITPTMRALESQDPDRHLIGFDDRLILQRHFEIMRALGLVGGSGSSGRWPGAGAATGTSAAASLVRPADETGR